MFVLTMDFLANPHRLWAYEHYNDKRTVLILTFADKLTYSRQTGYRTPKMSLPFNILKENNMVQKENGALGMSIPDIHALHPSGPLRGVESFPTIQSNHFEASFAVRLLRMY